MRVDLLTDGTGEIVLARRLSTGDLLRQNRQRCLQSVREVAGPRRRAGDAPFAIGEQPVQIINQRRHFVGILTFEPAASSLAHIAETLAEHGDRREPSANHGEAGRDERCASQCEQTVVNNQRRMRVACDDGDGDRNGGSQQPGGPEHGTGNEAGMKRAELHASPMR